MTFFELEKECKKRQKRLFIVIVSVVVVIISLLLFLIYYLVGKNNTKISKKKNTITEINKTETKINIVNSYVEDKKVENNLSISSDSLNNKEKNKNKVEKIEVKKENYKEFVLKPILDLNISNKEKNETSTSKKVKKENSKIQDLKTNNNTNNNIFSTTSLPSFETCVKLAKNYYKKGDYKNALKWAKNANLQNKKDKRSWIIVAKSLYKLGKKEKAINILQIYYNYTKDNEVLKIIERMKNGSI
jgi:tetratricopeptide (TPR) repeat protein